MPKNKKPAGGRPARNFDPSYASKRSTADGSAAVGSAVLEAGESVALALSRWGSPHPLGMAEVEDLLSAALNLDIDQCYLDVHYRSQNADLIAFSNDHFYTCQTNPFCGPVTA